VRIPCIFAPQGEEIGQIFSIRIIHDPPLRVLPCLSVLPVFAAGKVSLLFRRRRRRLLLRLHPAPARQQPLVPGPIHLLQAIVYCAARDTSQSSRPSWSVPARDRLTRAAGFQFLTVASALPKPLVSCLPSELKQTALTSSECPLRGVGSSPLTRSIVAPSLSRLPLASRTPSGLHDTGMTALSCPLRERSCSPRGRTPDQDRLVPASRVPPHTQGAQGFLPRLCGDEMDASIRIARRDDVAAAAGPCNLGCDIAARGDDGH